MSELEDFLIEHDLITKGDLEKAKRVQTETGQPFCSALRLSSVLQGNELARALSKFYEIPVLTSEEWPTTPVFSDKFSTAFLRDSKVFPIADTGNSLLLAMADPGNTYASNAVGLAINRTIVPKIASAEDIDAAIERAARDDVLEDVFVDDSASEDVAEDVEHLRDIALGTPVVRLVNQLLQDAVHSRATDIHIEPFHNRISIRMRIDGMLRDMRSPPNNLGKAIISRLKILSGLNIAERRLPQDGRARIKIDGRALDLRIATMPAIHGETMVIRLLDNVRRALDLGKLGFNTQDEQVLLKCLSASHGLVIVTGPTGSGKTTTLATALSLLNESHRKILTIEDPIEYELDGINQTQTKPSIGLSFATALRGFLRHDPDIIMVGEMRDGETASIGVHAALTGHLVLTTLHTNTAAGAITRLLDMGVDAYLLASCLRCVIGQRLVRLVCQECSETYTDTPDFPQKILDSLGIKPGAKRKLRRAIGCDRCFGTGYSDRIVISEVLDVNEDIRALIQPGIAAGQIEQIARNNNMTTMLGDGLQKCLDGLTTPEEINRVAMDM